MVLLKKLKSLLGLEEGQSSGDQREDDSVGVTVEHDRGDQERASEPGAETGGDAGGGVDAEPESGSEGPPIGSASEPGGSEPIDSEEPIDEETATDPEEAPPGTDAPGTETAEPAPAETDDTSEEGVGVDGTVDVDPEVDSPGPTGDEESGSEARPESEPMSESGPAVDVDSEADAGTEPEPTPEPEPDSTTEADPESGITDTPTGEATAGGTDESAGETEEELQDIKGIGPSYEAKLSEAGVESVGELADADADDLAEDTGLSTKRIREWIDRARSR